MRNHYSSVRNKQQPYIYKPISQDTSGLTCFLHITDEILQPYLVQSDPIRLTREKWNLSIHRTFRPVCSRSLNECCSSEPLSARTSCQDQSPAYNSLLTTHGKWQLATCCSFLNLNSLPADVQLWHSIPTLLARPSALLPAPLYLQMLRHYKLEALGQCIPLPRHVLPVSRYGSGSVIWIATKI